jgi:hypothetical protein
MSFKGGLRIAVVETHRSGRATRASLSMRVVYYWLPGDRRRPSHRIERALVVLMTARAAMFEQS